MNKNWDTVMVGVVTFVIVALILIIKPGYTPIEISDELLNPPAAVETVEEEEADGEAALEVEADADAETE